MIGLGIESTCDETSLALVRLGKEILSCITYSQIQEHHPFQGVVPELASRSHLEKLNPLLDRLMQEGKEKFNLSWEDIQYVAVAVRPGLLGSLMMGAQLARCIGLVHNIPIVPVHHLEAHLAAILLDTHGLEDLPFPYLGLLLSGGNSAIYIHKDWNQLEILGDTLDDAMGEAFDKAAGILGLGYPGGPAMEKAAREFEGSSLYFKLGYEEDSFQNFLLPRLLRGEPKDTIHFSFSGLKTALLYTTRKRNDWDTGRLAYEFQEICFDLVLRNLEKAVQLTNYTTIVAGGGVLANSKLRKKLDKFSASYNIHIRYPQAKFLCTDNAAMVASTGYFLFKKGISVNLDFLIHPSPGLMFWRSQV